MRKHWKQKEKRGASGGHEAIVEGVIQHKGTFAFLLSEKPGVEDVFIRGRGLDLAMDGDRVQAKVRPEKTGRLAGEIIKVVKRAHTSMVGILRRVNNSWALFPEKGSAPPALVSGFAQKLVPVEGSFAVLEVKRWPESGAGASGIVTEILGDPGDIRARIDSILRARGINEVFPKEVTDQAAAYGSRLEPAAWKGREVLFDLPVCTIDGADAKDFDDAVSLEDLGNGMLRLGVHIADVANYVKPGTALDKEAYERATSVYLPDRVVPMLPPALSDNLCSLVPRQERLTLSAFMDIDRNGKVTKRRLAETVIRSWRRFTYEEVQALLDGASVPDVHKSIGEAVLRMGALMETLYRRRVQRGALDFNLPEYKVNADPHGRPLGVSLRPRLKSHRLIEEFMLLANEAVATELYNAKMPFLHRRHDTPDPLKLKALSSALGELGLTAGHIEGKNAAKGLQDVLRQASGHPLTNLINSLMVRSMRQAVYSPESEGHFGIATRFYSHFTSPIRRYPDLMTHRAVKSLLRGKKENHGALPLDKAGVHCSERERAASDAEHKSVDIMRAEMLKELVGSVIDGAVTTVIDSGAFVMLGETGAEGLLRVNGLKPGTKVKVMIAGVDTAEGKIDLSLEGRPAPAAGGKPQGGGQGQPKPGRDRWKFSDWKKGKGGGNRGGGRGRSRGRR
jgi:ribonuclease R